MSKKKKKAKANEKCCYMGIKGKKAKVYTRALPWPLF